MKEYRYNLHLIYEKGIIFLYLKAPIIVYEYLTKSKCVNKMANNFAKQKCEQNNANKKQWVHLFVNVRCGEINRDL